MSDTDAGTAARAALKAEAELRKLREESKALEFENSWKGRSLKSLTALSVIAAGIGLLLTYNSGSAQRASEQRQAELKLLTETLERATNDQASPARRFVAIWSVVPYWERGEYDELLANSLAAILISDREQLVRFAAADAIGLAIRPDTPASRKQHLARVLYGSSRTWDVGAVAIQGYNVTHDNVPQGDGPSHTEQIIAIRQAIRTNREFLEDTHFATLDLRH